MLPAAGWIVPFPNEFTSRAVLHDLHALAAVLRAVPGPIADHDTAVFQNLKASQEVQAQRLVIRRLLAGKSFDGSVWST